jgi:hypothetical protein
MSTHHRLPSQSRRFRSVIVSIASALVLIGVPASAQAVSRSTAANQSRQSLDGASKSLAKSSLCNKVSAASVSAIIGYKVPAGVPYVHTFKPSKSTFETSGTDTTCTYGAMTSMAAIVKSVTLEYETISKALTPQQIQQSLAQSSKLAKFKFTTISVAGDPAFYFSLSESGITGQGIIAVQNGTTYFGATVESKTVSKSKLGALAQLAQGL